MLKKVLLHGVFAAGFIVAVALTNVTAQSVNGSIANGTVTKGKAAKVTVVLTIPGGLHVNSSRPGSEYAIPTSVRASARGIRIGTVNYPRGRDRKFEFSENTINVYEGRVAFTFNVTVPATFTGRNVAVNISVKYQACTNEVCYPPKTKQITLTARVN